MRLRAGFLGIAVAIAAAAATADGPDPVPTPLPNPPGVSAVRGRYLAEGVCECFECHSPIRNESLVEPDPSKLGSGDILNKKEHHVAPNITPDRETGAGNWTDAQLIRAIREGIGHDGRRLSLVMPYWKLSILTDDDVRSIVAYLRSIPPVRKALPHWTPTRDTEPPPVPPLPPAKNADVATVLGRGEYLVHLAGCVHCHTARPLNGTQWERRKDLEFGGGRRFEATPTFDELETDPGFASPPATMPGPKSFTTSPNLTTDPSGIPYYDENLFIQTIRTGSVAGVRPLTRAMLWFEFRKLTDDDLKAIFAYIRSRPPMKHRVSNSDPPTFCPVCGRYHGLGDSNEPPVRN
ncbi:MAG TPA: cytochrome c [Thermoanaerobaculia bacterium]